MRGCLRLGTAHSGRAQGAACWPTGKVTFPRVQVDARGGITLQAVGMVKEVAATAEGFRVVLPPGVVAMAARPGSPPLVGGHVSARVL